VVQQASLLVPDRYARHPAWSHDGSQIAYVDGSGEIAVVSSNGGPAVSLGIEGDSPSWGPDGRIVFERDGHLWIVDPASRKILQLTNGPGCDATPA
jgi:Tol biopolymer transport system component